MRFMGGLMNSISRHERYARTWFWNSRSRPASNFSCASAAVICPKALRSPADISRRIFSGITFESIPIRKKVYAEPAVQSAIVGAFIIFSLNVNRRGSNASNEDARCNRNACEPQAHAHSKPFLRIGAVIPNSLSAAGFKSIPAPFLMLRVCGIVSPRMIL